MAIDSTRNTDAPVQAPPKTADRPLQDPIEALKQLTGHGDKSLSGNDKPAAASSGEKTGGEPAYLDMGDAGSLYKSRASIGGHDSAARAKKQDGGPAAPALEDKTVRSARSLTTGGAKSDNDGGREVERSEHTVSQGETLTGISRQALGPKANSEAVKRYADAISVANQLNDDDKIKPGQKLDMPGHKKDGTVVLISPDNRDELWSVHKDDSYDVHNNKANTDYSHTAIGKDGSYSENHTGPGLEDNYIVNYDGSSHVETTIKVGPDLSTRVSDSTGYQKVQGATGDISEVFSEDSQIKSADTNILTSTTVKQDRDGSTETSAYDKHLEVVDPDGTKTTRWPDGKVLVQKQDDRGHETGHAHEPVVGGYTEHGWGPRARDNYDETYNAKTGTTVRTEAPDRAEERQITKWADGTVKVETRDGHNYQAWADGREHHWGKENYDKPAFDYTIDKQLGAARSELQEAVKNHVPEWRRDDFKDDMATFEKRAAKVHLSPEEIAKTYEQISRMLNVPESASVVPGNRRAILAEGLIHQVADPADTDQGFYNTCNVTTLAEQTQAKNPSKVAEMAATTTITGEWKAPDGKVIKIDRDSLKPSMQAGIYPPFDVDGRTYATQVLNLVMANDALQRRNPPESYVQRTPSYYGDNGERHLRADGSEVKEQQYDLATNKWEALAQHGPGITGREIAEVGKRLNGDSYHLIGVNATQSGYDNVRSSEELQELLIQFKNQGQLPVTIAVDGNHAPISSKAPVPGTGAHVVTIQDYDPVTQKVQISNQWGKADDKAVDVDDLFHNASGDKAMSRTPNLTTIGRLNVPSATVSP